MAKSVVRVNEENKAMLEERYGIVDGDTLSVVMKKMVAYHNGVWCAAEGQWKYWRMDHYLGWSDGWPSTRLCWGENWF